MCIRDSYNPQPPYQNTGQQYKNAPKPSGKGAPKGPPPRRGEKGTKTSGKRGRPGPKTPAPKARGRRTTPPPGVKSTSADWEEEGSEYPPEESGYDEPQNEDPDAGWDGEEEENEEQEEPYEEEEEGQEETQEEPAQPPPVPKSMVNMILTTIKDFAEGQIVDKPVVKSQVATATTTDDLILLKSLALEPPATMAKTTTTSGSVSYTHLTLPTIQPV